MLIIMNTNDWVIGLWFTLWTFFLFSPFICRYLLVDKIIHPIRICIVQMNVSNEYIYDHVSISIHHNNIMIEPLYRLMLVSVYTQIRLFIFFSPISLFCMFVFFFYYFSSLICNKYHDNHRQEPSCKWSIYI